MVDEDFLKRYRESVDLGEDNYSVIDKSCVKPIKKDYTYWDDYWEDLVRYLKERYKYTYGSKAQKK